MYEEKRKQDGCLLGTDRLLLDGCRRACPAGRSRVAVGGRKTDWLYKAKWGVMAHFTRTFLQSDETVGPIDDQKWNEIIASFDAQGLADQIQQCGAGYLLLSARHGIAPPLAPNSIIERTARESAPGGT